jgi:glycosyltransferase involved in cell wall biosynthesis
LEALSCGLPVVAYKSKGPKDIIEHGQCGYLATNKKEMIEYTQAYLMQEEKHPEFRKNAIKRATVYNKQAILNQLLEDLRLA